MWRMRLLQVGWMRTWYQIERNGEGGGGEMTTTVKAFLQYGTKWLQRVGGIEYAFNVR